MSPLLGASAKRSEGAGVVEVGRYEDWLGYGERARPACAGRVYLTIRKGAKPEEAFGRRWCFKAKSRTEVDAF
jgi:hypothetical protein